MTQFAIKVRGIFNDIYEWGNGFKDNETYSAWHRFWGVEFGKKHRLFWKYAEGDNFGGCGHLSSNSGSIYMHPMDFTAVLVASSGCVKVSPSKEGKDYYNHFESELRTLKEICDECAAYCGGSFNLQISKEFAIEVPENRELVDYEEVAGEDYVTKIGVAR